MLKFFFFFFLFLVYWCYYPHTWKHSVSPVFGISFLYTHRTLGHITTPYNQYTVHDHFTANKYNTELYCCTALQQIVKQCPSSRVLTPAQFVRILLQPPHPFVCTSHFSLQNCSLGCGTPKTKQKLDSPWIMVSVGAKFAVNFNIKFRLSKVNWFWPKIKVSTISHKSCLNHSQSS